MAELDRKHSKIYCKVSRNVPIWEKFEEDEDKRVQMLDMNIKLSDVAYVKEAAHRKGVSDSCMFEKILDKYFFSKMCNTVLFLPNSFKGLYGNATRSVPKWHVHPVYIELLRAMAEKRRLPVSVMLSEILLSYKMKYPKTIRAEYLPE